MPLLNPHVGSNCIFHLWRLPMAKKERKLPPKMHIWERTLLPHCCHLISWVHNGVQIISEGSFEVFRFLRFLKLVLYYNPVFWTHFCLMTSFMEFWGKGSTENRFMLKFSSRIIFLYFEFHWLLSKQVVKCLNLNFKVNFQRQKS